MSVPKTQATLAANLRALLKLHKWSESELARRAKVSQKTINNIMHGVYRPKIETVDQLAKPFGLTGWLLIHPALVRSLEGGGTIARLVEAYLDSPEEGQKLILGMAEREAQRKAR